MLNIIAHKFCHLQNDHADASCFLTNIPILKLLRLFSFTIYTNLVVNRVLLLGEHGLGQKDLKNMLYNLPEGCKSSGLGQCQS